jgi:hypothetical protein
VGKFKYLRTTITNQNYIYEEIKSRLNSEDACYHAVHILVTSCLLSRNKNIKICKTITSLAVLYGCGNWFLTLREEHRLRAFEKRVVRRIVGPRRSEVTGGGENCMMRSCIIFLFLK